MSKKRRSTKARREWDRGTDLIRLFLLTGHLIPRGGERVHPQSLLLVGPPGCGKTELLMRFRGNWGVEFRSDITVRGLWRLLLQAQKGRLRHVLLPEFNKVFQRKTSTAVNCVGTLTEAMEEGVWEGDVGPMKWSFDGARLGVIGGMTAKTLKKRRDLLYEVGFLDRCAVLPWSLSGGQMRDILHRITQGDKTDLLPVKIPRLERPVVVDLPAKVGAVLEQYVWERWPDESLRLLTRFRYLTMAAAVSQGRDVCSRDDVEMGVFQFADYWDRLILTPSAEEMLPNG